MIPVTEFQSKSCVMMLNSGSGKMRNIDVVRNMVMARAWVVVRVRILFFSSNVQFLAQTHYAGAAGVMFLVTPQCTDTEWIWR